MKKLKEAIASLEDAMATEFALAKQNITDWRSSPVSEENDEIKETKQKLKGGKADKMTPQSIAKKHKKPFKQISNQLKKGIKHEMEHTDDDQKAKEIAMDHISEDPLYYDKLSKAGIDERWSEKYKKSIDCKNPKGFSQKAHCQGRKKKSENKEATGAGSAGGFESPLFGTIKKETKEATGSGSGVGSYETPKMWAKSLKKKDWKGASKTQIPGGKFVQVKEKCKRFPYCNQGDIKALKIFDNKLVEKVIKNISLKNNISEDIIRKKIIEYLIG